MRWKTTLSLILLNIIVFFFLYRSGNNEISEADNEKWKILLKSHKIKFLAIQTQQNKISFEKKRHDLWSITHPFSWTANKFILEQIIHISASLDKKFSFSIEEIQNKGQSLKDFGLEKPEVILSFSAGKKVHQIKFGRSSLDQNKFYILDPSNKRIFVSDAEKLHPIFLANNEFCDTTIFNFNPSSVNFIQLHGPNCSTLLQKVSEKNWQIKIPVETTVNSHKMNALIAEIMSLRAIDFLDFSPQKIDSEKQQEPYKLTINGTSQSETITLYPLHDEKNTFVGYSDKHQRTFSIQTNAIQNLIEANELLRERQLLAFSKKNVHRVELLKNNSSFTLEKLDANNWQLINLKEENTKIQKADNAKIFDLLKNLKNLTVEKFVNDSPNKEDLSKLGFFDEAKQAIKIHLKDDTLNLQLSNKNDKLYLKLNDNPSVYQISSLTNELLSFRSNDYKCKTLFSLPSNSKLKAISIKKFNSIEILNKQFNAKENNYRSSFFTEDQNNALNFIVENSKNFSIKQYNFNKAALSNSDSHEQMNLFWPYKMVVEFEENNQISQKEVLFSERIGGNLQYGFLPSSQTSFSLTQAWIDALFELTNHSRMRQKAKILNPTLQQK